jgi:hypothetical protein
VNRFWGGRGNLAEVHIEPPFGPIDFLALRWYNPTAHQWFLTFANAANGTLGVPLAGVFNNGWLDLYDAEPMDGKQILVHFAIWPTSKDAGASEQAFSAAGGRTWEVNYKTRYTRIAVKWTLAGRADRPQPHRRLPRPVRQHSCSLSHGRRRFPPRLGENWPLHKGEAGVPPER